MTDNNLKLM